MNEKEQLYGLIAFLAVLVAIVILTVLGAFLIIKGQSTEGLGVAAAVTGLIGVLGTFKPRTPSNSEVTVKNKLSDPIPTTDTDAPAGAPAAPATGDAAPSSRGV